MGGVVRWAAPAHMPTCHECGRKVCSDWCPAADHASQRRDKFVLRATSTPLVRPRTCERRRRASLQGREAVPAKTVFLVPNTPPPYAQQVACPLASLGTIIRFATAKLGLALPASRLFDSGGQVITSSAELNNGDVLTVSCGEGYWGTVAAQRRRRFRRAGAMQRLHSAITRSKSAPICEMTQPRFVAPSCVNTKKRDAAATTIQCIWRGFIERRKPKPQPKKVLELVIPKPKPAQNVLVTFKKDDALADGHGYATTGLRRIGQYTKTSSFLNELKGKDAPSWWADCVSPGSEPA